MDLHVRGLVDELSFAEPLDGGERVAIELHLEPRLLVLKRTTGLYFLGVERRSCRLDLALHHTLLRLSFVLYFCRFCGCDFSGYFQITLNLQKKAEELKLVFGLIF